jgi:hypothetical protein
VGALACRVMLPCGVTMRRNPYLPHYRTAFAFSRILYPHAYRPHLRLAFLSSLTRERGEEAYGLTVFRVSNSEGYVLSIHRWCFVAHDQGRPSPGAHHNAFWLQPNSNFGWSGFTMFIESSHKLTIPRTLAPSRLMLAATPAPCGFGARLMAVGYVVRRLLDRLLPPGHTS